MKTLIGTILLLSGMAMAAPNYDEAQIGTYTVPSLFATGSRGKTMQSWPQRRRDILKEFAANVYGPVPTTSVNFAADGSTKTVFAGKAVRELVTLTLQCEDRELPIDLLIYRPVGAGPWPVIVGLNFCGNQSVYPDPGIPLCRTWVNGSREAGIPGNQATEESRGSRSGRWPIEAIVSRGYAVCTVAYGDLEPDVDDGFSSAGVHRLLGSKEPYGAISAWAWGCSRIADYLQTRPWVDRIGVMGHSRLGKTALWAGANDSRFGLVISNDSGCMGAALSRRQVGETAAAIYQQFPHWFVPGFAQYADREDALPVDQHQLLALMAGRALYVASAESDLWADPIGEEASVQLARPAFELLGGEVGYHRRPGMHNVTVYDWERYLDFADRAWKPKKI